MWLSRSLQWYDEGLKIYAFMQPLKASRHHSPGMLKPGKDKYNQAYLQARWISLTLEGMEIECFPTEYNDLQVSSVEKGALKQHLQHWRQKCYC